MSNKVCNKCQIEKSLELYKPDKRNKDGKQGICVDCNREHKRLQRIKARITGPITAITTKTCNKCKKTKAAIDFFKDSGISDGRATICKSCKTESSLAWRATNREQYNASQRAQHAKNYQRNRLYRYDLTPEEHAKMLVDQNNGCAICGKIPNGKRPLAIDHCHTTGKVRSLLCYGCNRALHALETIDLRQKAEAYLKKHNED